MRLIRGLLGVLLWIVAALLGLVGLVLCVTVILLPVGIPIVKMAGRFFTSSVQLMLPRAVAHPVDELTKTAHKKGRKVGSVASDTANSTAKKARKAVRNQRKLLA